ncbi:hypothetical protein GWK36_02060 [Caldichromatium japonicum]|uniref:SprA-related family protein n=2 Tax=Caldichromatium japonicum TaxID=2699430 RepID=A0A6G7VGE6_9GAMM|nr:hypothetical protein GWK36_02060 [Caldichromatium japonicum]
MQSGTSANKSAGAAEEEAKASASSPDLPQEPGAGAAQDQTATGRADSAEPSPQERDPLAPKDARGETLSRDDQRLIEQLKQRDAEVRAHEQAHIAAGGAYITSGPSYSYQTGPDGRRYAIGGEVGIDTSMNPDDPEGNLAKARAIIRAAMAPAEPSGQDVRVAAAARAMEMRAQQDLRERQIRIYESVMKAGIAETRDISPSTSRTTSGGSARLAIPSGQSQAGVSRFA